LEFLSSFVALTPVGGGGGGNRAEEWR
jgi:hypothetical protein